MIKDGIKEKFEYVQIDCLFFFEKIFFIKVPDQPIRVGWFPANCVQLLTDSTPRLPTDDTYQNIPSIE